MFDETIVSVLATQYIFHSPNEEHFCFVWWLICKAPRKHFNCSLILHDSLLLTLFH